MKKQIIAAAAFIASSALIGCNAQPEEKAVANVEMVADDIEARANALEAQAFNATMPAEVPVMTNAGDAAINTTANQSDGAR